MRNLRLIFTSNKWLASKRAKEEKGKQVLEIVFMPSFWNHVVYILKVMHSLVKVFFLLVNNERKLAMGYIYEAKNRCNKTIKKSFNKNEAKYKEIFSIIDKR